MFSHTARLTVALAATWLLLAGPAAMRGGVTAVEGLSYAAGLCLLPHLLWAAFQFVAQPRMQPFAQLLVMMALRMGIVLAGVVFVWTVRADLRFANFVVWLLPCYLVSLAVETRLAVADPLQADRPARRSEDEFVDSTSFSGSPAGG